MAGNKGPEYEAALGTYRTQLMLLRESQANLKGG